MAKRSFTTFAHDFHPETPPTSRLVVEVDPQHPDPDRKATYVHDGERDPRMEVSFITGPSTTRVHSPHTANSRPWNSVATGRVQGFRMASMHREQLNGNTDPLRKLISQADAESEVSQENESDDGSHTIGRSDFDDGSSTAGRSEFDGDDESSDDGDDDEEEEDDFEDPPHVCVPHCRFFGHHTHDLTRQKAGDRWWTAEGAAATQGRERIG